MTLAGAFSRYFLAALHATPVLVTSGVRGYTFPLKNRKIIIMSLIVKTTYRVREADKASFLADFSVVAQATMAAPACDWIYVAEDLEENTVVAMSYWQSEAGFDDHLRWRIGTSRWTEMEQKYLTAEPEFSLMPVMSRFRETV